MAKSLNIPLLPPKIFKSIPRPMAIVNCEMINDSKILQSKQGMYMYTNYIAKIKKGTRDT